MNTSFTWSGFTLVLALLLSGCARPPSEAPAPAPIPVTVSHPVQRSVTDYADFTARTAAIDSVEVRARVWGYLDKVFFKEGELVKKGDVLFEVDPRPYQAALDLNQGQVQLAEAQLKLASADNARANEISKTPGAISKQDIDRYAAQQSQADAQLQVARANLDNAKLNLGWTKVRAPIDGRISRFLVTTGNLLQSGEAGGTLLTTIVSVDPIYAYFDVDERTVLRVRQLIREGKAKSARESEWPVALGLASDTGFPHQGTINFVDNQVNPKTGTLRVRGVFANPTEALSPGFFGRVRVPIGFAHSALLISDRAIDNDQGQKVVYVVNENNEVVARPIRTGMLHDGLREITEGLKAGDRVIVNGLQQVRPGAIVEPKLVEMPNGTQVTSAKYRHLNANPQIGN